MSHDLRLMLATAPGPNFEMADYLAFIERRGPWSPKAERPTPSSVGPGLLRFAKALICLAIHMVLVSHFSPLTLESDEFFGSSLWKR